jgi:hypothetical protein
MLKKLESAKPNPSQMMLDDIKKRNDTLGKAYDGWTSMVKRIDDLHTGKSSSVFVPIVPVVNLVSEQLLDNVKNLDGSKASSADEIRTINAISFVGGGSAIQYSVERSLEETKWKGTGFMQEFLVGAYTAGDPEFTVIGIEFEANFKLGGRFVQTTNDGKTTGKVSSSTFTLSDPDVGDEFDVQVYRDPDYGSLFFKTKAGRSKFVPMLSCFSLLLHRCIHEANTVRREGVALLHASGDGVQRQILPGDPAVFEVIVT